MNFETDSKLLYKARARIEQMMGKIKRFKRIALRCEKTVRNYTSGHLD
jgi:transposase